VRSCGTSSTTIVRHTHAIMLSLASAIYAYSTTALPSGCYEGSVPFIIDNKVVINGDGTADLDINVKITSQEIVCKAEKSAVTSSQVTFPNVANTGDCMGDALRGQSKDPTKYYLTVGDDGSLTFLSDGYPPLKMSQCSSTKSPAPLSPEWQEVVNWRNAMVTAGDLKAAPSGKFCGSVPFIISVTADLGDTCNLDIDVKITGQDVSCPTEAYKASDTEITFPNVANTGDCMGDALRGQSKDPTKYTLSVNSDGTLTFNSDGYPPLKMTSC